MSDEIEDEKFDASEKEEESYDDDDSEYTASEESFLRGYEEDKDAADEVAAVEEESVDF